MVFFTCFIQGSTIKFFVKLMHIRLRKEEAGKGAQLVSEVQASLMENIMAGLEVIQGCSGHNQHIRRFKQFEQTYIRPYLKSQNQDSRTEALERELDKVILEDHYTNLYGPSIVAEVSTFISYPVFCKKIIDAL